MLSIKKLLKKSSAVAPEVTVAPVEAPVVELPKITPFAWEPNRVIIYTLAAVLGVTVAYAGVSTAQNNTADARAELSYSVHDAKDRALLLSQKADAGRAYIIEAERFAEQNDGVLNDDLIGTIYNSIDAADQRIAFADKAAAATEVEADNAFGKAGDSAGTLRDAAHRLDRMIVDDPKISDAIDNVKTAVGAGILAGVTGPEDHKK